MFLGNLSTSTERQARQGQKKNQKKGKSTGEKDSDDDEQTTSSSEPVVPLRRANELPILYTGKDGKEIPRDALLGFLHQCVDMMLDPAHIKYIVLKSTKQPAGLHVSAIEFQRDVLEYNCQIERNYGCKYLSMLGQTFANDDELIEAAKKFMFTCMRCYLKCLKLRYKFYKSSVLEGPPANQSMTRRCILEFFEGCNALMAMPETKEELKSIFSSTKSLPNQRVIDLQRSILKLLGYNPDFAVSCLNRMQSDYGEDREVMIKMQQFALCAELSCREASFSEDEKKNFYQQIPPLMHHFPHMHVFQQRIAQQQMMMQMQNSGDRAKEIEALKQSGILNLVSTPEGREKLMGLAERVQKTKTSSAEHIKDWSEDQKIEFLQHFHERNIVNVLSNAGEDPLSKIAAFIEMPEDALEDAVKLQLVVGSDSKFVKQIREPGEGSPEIPNAATLNLVFTTMSALSSSNMRMMSGGHHHGGGHSCDVHGGRSNQADISVTKSDKMDR